MIVSKISVNVHYRIWCSNFRRKNMVPMKERLLLQTRAHYEDANKTQGKNE